MSGDSDSSGANIAGTLTMPGAASYIVLGHLSESNNAPELARLAAEQALTNHPSLLGNRILLAEQSAPLEPICL